MVGRERRGGRQRRAGRAGTDTPVHPAAPLGWSFTVLADSERARPPRSSPDPASTAGTRSAAVVAGCRAAEGFQGVSLSTNSIALLIRCPGWLVEKDIDAVVGDGELDPLHGEPDFHVPG
ncbi:unknown (plasmid) [Haloarcula marismortui ATCC 43049]|jgi:hypothetical protein|uniref:Uncharacterized protein n=1 Tax=Haloarcula marismortui (strain ATCC 43049 / DSM 3752 / JCM 8966 / VKM B-1809) TaxID=272569 RepID=Q5V777_HALMA|nr:unknown [Haloarcula marismortui ATCC 43049]